MFRFCIILSLISFAAGAIPLSISYDPNPRLSAGYPGNFDAVDYYLHIPLTEPYDEIDGAYVRITLANPDVSDSLVLLDLDGMTCDSIIFTHPLLYIYEYCDFSQYSGTLAVELPFASPVGDTFFLTIYYHGIPDGGYYVQNNRYDNRVIYSLSWPSNARCWFPCIDYPADKATATIEVIAPSDLKVAANGIRTSADTTGTIVTHIFQMEQAICTYNICFTAADYIFWSDTSGSGIPIWYFAYPEDSAAAHYDWERTGEIMDSFEVYYGEYPFDRYGTATTPFGLGGMEHQTITFLGDGLITGTRAYESVVAHELSHSWFGNSVGLGDWRDFWLNEGFAVFSEFYYTEIFFGEEAAKDYRHSTQQSYRSSGENFPPYDPDVYLSTTCYNRGGCIMEMLRFLLGDSTFFDAVQQWTSRYRYRTVTTDSFRILMEELYGSSLDWFFDEWVYSGDYPKFNYWYECWSEGDSFETRLHIEQDSLFCAYLFTTPLEIKYETAGGNFYDTLWLDDWSQDFYRTFADTMTRVRIDPNYHVLRSTEHITAVGESGQKPSRFSISISPNPFNSICRIFIEGGANEHITGALYNILGEKIKKIDVDLSYGNNIISIDGSELNSGVYFVKLTNGNKDFSKRIFFVK